MNTGHIQVFSAYLWCTIALRWFPTERKRGESTPINMWQIIWDHGLKYSRCTTNICPSDRQRSSKMRKNESVVEGTALPILHVCGWPAAGGFHQHGNRACKCMSECFNQSRSERERQQPGQRLLVLNWILTGSTKQGSCRVTGGCAAMDVNTWVDISWVQSILWLFALISLLLEKHWG